MAIYYIDPVSGDDGTGAADDSDLPYLTWATVSPLLSNNDTVSLKSGTTLQEQITIPQQSLTFNMYGGTAKATIDGELTRNYCFYGLDKGEGSGITIQNLEIVNAVFNGILMQYSTAGGTAAKTLVFTDLDIHGIGDGTSTGAYEGTGLLVANDGFPGATIGYSGATVTVTTTNVVAYDCDKHGVDYRGNVNGVTSDSISHDNAAVNGGHGFSTHPVPGTITDQNWVNVSGNIYRHDATATGYTSNAVTHVSVGAYGSYTQGRALSRIVGPQALPGSHEWGFVAGSPDYLYINLGGVDPSAATYTVSFARNPMGPLIYEDCEAYNIHTVGGAEGFGFSADGTSVDVTFRRCNSHDNYGSGFKNLQAKDVTIVACKTTNNGGHGVTEGNQCLGNKILHTVSSGNNFSGFDVVNARSQTVKNCIAINNGTYGFDAAFYSDVTQAGNIGYGNTTAETDAANFGAVTESDPLLDSSYIPAVTSPAYRAGSALTGYYDYRGHKFSIPPTIGAYEFTSGSPAQARTAASTRSVATTRTTATTRTARE